MKGFRLKINFSEQLSIDNNKEHLLSIKMYTFIPQRLKYVL